MKLSAGKASLPGGKQVFRQYDSHGQMAGDVIALEEESGRFRRAAADVGNGRRTAHDAGKPH